MTPGQKRAFRMREKVLAEEVANAAGHLVDARDYAAIYFARIRLQQAIRELVLHADSTWRSAA